MQWHVHHWQLVNFSCFSGVCLIICGMWKISVIDQWCKCTSVQLFSYDSEALKTEVIVQDCMFPSGKARTKGVDPCSFNDVIFISLFSSAAWAMAFYHGILTQIWSL